MKKIVLIVTLSFIVFSGLVLFAASDRLFPAATNGNGTLSVDAAQAASAVDAQTRHNLALEEPTGDVIEIKEKMFVAQTNDVYYNPEDYLGKTLKYEGLFDAYDDPSNGQTYYAVIRYGPGCCGIDLNAGFEVKWENDYPTPNDWVEAVGVLEEYEENGQKYLRLALSSLTVLPVRGAETVWQ